MSLQTVKAFDYFIIILENGAIKNCPLCIVIFLTLQFSSVQSLSRDQLFATP